MTTEPTTNPDSESPPVEETIPLVKPEGSEEEKQLEEKQPPTPEEMDRFECRSCGYTYEPTKGDSRSETPRGVPFKELPSDWRCSVCGSSKSQFSNIGPAGTASGFKENLSYGFGVNTLTPGQKNVLIFGALGLAVLFFLSLYGLR
ncbi:MAG: rubredoxin [Phormidesmis sp.]